VTIVVRHHAGMELHRVEYLGSVTAAELSALVDFQAAHPRWLACDALNLVPLGSDFAGLNFKDLDAAFRRYRELFAQKEMMVLRRAAWLCRSPAAQPTVDNWINARNLRQGMASEVRQFNTFEEACGWLVLPPESAAQLENGAGFKEIGRFEMPRPLTR
jgi:hypothetical protein